MTRSIGDDVRFGFRLLWRHPGFSALALFTLALGVGANTAVFSLVRGVLLKPLPFTAPEHLIWIGGKEARTAEKAGVSIPDLLDIREQSRALHGVAAYSFLSEKLVLNGAGEPEQIDGSRVTANFFDVLGVAPAHGRVFRDGEDRLGGPRVAVLSHALWTRSYGASPNAIGGTIILNAISHQIIGVMPASFAFPRGAAVWVTVQNGAASTKIRDARTFLAIGRVGTGRSLPIAAQELDGIARRLGETFPASNHDYRFETAPLADAVTGEVRGTLFLLGGITAFLLLIAAANIANLLLSRATGRKREVAIRHAMGASPGAIVRQLLIENIVLSIAGGLLGSVFAWWAIRGLHVWNPPQLPRVDEVALDPAALLFALFISLSTALAFGLAPALQAVKEDQFEALKDAGTRGGGEGSGRAKLRNILVVAEIAMAVVLLSGAGLLLESLRRMLAVDPGFQTTNTVTTELTLPLRKFRSLDGCTQFVEAYLQRIRALPQVDAAGSAVALPMGSVYAYYEFRIAGDPATGAPAMAGQTSVTPGYFEAMGIPLKQGRLFEPRDNKDGAKAAIISEPMARQYFTGRNPIGQRLQMIIGGQVAFEGEIVGVVGGVRHQNLTQPPRIEFYLPFAQSPYPIANIVVRRRGGGADGMAAAMKQVMRELDRDIPLYRIRPMEDVVMESASEARARGFLTGLFALAALLLASIGIYGVMSYAVSRRAQEIGIRMAVGATPLEVLGMILAQSGKLVAMGLVIGLIATLALGRLLTTMLFGVESFDATVLAAVSGLLVVVAMIATAIPAWRAARIDPVRALRQE
jgi:putative ABC transport system permease protein